MNEGEEIGFIDLYSGVGGFRKGLERANQISKHSKLWIGDKEGQSEQLTEIGGLGEGSSGIGYRCVWSCDNNRWANQIYTKQFGEANHYSGDIRGVDPGDIPDFDLLCAGFPCQSFSVAGKRKGFQDTRGTLFFEISRIAEAKRPQMLLLENVKGLLSNDRGQTFQTILQELGRIGYWTEWQVFNSKHHGVPQNRERVFLIGHSRSGRPRPIFPITSDGESSSQELRKIGNIAETGHDSIWGSVYNPDGIAMNVNAEGGGVGAKTGLYAVPVLTLDRVEKRQHGRRFKEPGDPSFTRTGQDIHGVAISFTNPHDSEEERRINLSDTSRAVKPPYGNQQPLTIDTDKYMIRRLTPCECERLQGFPDGWTEWGIDEDGEKVKISDTQRYRALGNAVTVNVIEFLGEHIKESFEKPIDNKGRNYSPYMEDLN